MKTKEHKIKTKDGEWSVMMVTDKYRNTPLQKKIYRVLTRYINNLHEDKMEVSNWYTYLVEVGDKVYIHASINHINKWINVLHVLRED